MTTKEKIFKTIAEIPEDRYPGLLEVVENFKNKSVNGKGGKWARFAGILTEEEANAMLAVIEETCERIDDD